MYQKEEIEPCLSRPIPDRTLRSRDEARPVNKYRPPLTTPVNPTPTHRPGTLLASQAQFKIHLETHFKTSELPKTKRFLGTKFLEISAELPLKYGLSKT